MVITLPAKSQNDLDYHYIASKSLETIIIDKKVWIQKIVFISLKTFPKVYSFFYQTKLFYHTSIDSLR